MTAKGYITGNGAADGLIEYLRMFALSDGENELTRRVADDIAHILRSEQHRTIARIAGRLDHALDGYIGDPRVAVRIALDEMMQAVAEGDFA